MSPKHTHITHDPNDDWAEVELFRWQHGDLPSPEDRRPLDVPTGLRKMADAIVLGDRANFPSPHNVVSALRYAAKKLEEKARKS
jgi:hypothetical protein